MKNLKTLQFEMAKWQEKNFPNSKAGEILYGLAEELGELADAIEIGSLENKRDALGDMSVFLLNYMSKMAINIEDLFMFPDDGYMYMPRPSYALTSYIALASTVGKVYHTHLKATQKIREIDWSNLSVALSNLWYQLESSALVIGEQSLLHIINDTWAVVSQRDWSRKATA